MSSELELPDDNATYKEQEYWEERFEKEESYDWLCDYAQFRHLLLPLLKPDSRILILGCGNSPFGPSLYQDGYHNITNIDFSSTVIDLQRQRHLDKPEMKWLTMDIMDLKFDKSSFDIVVDKATTDALLVDEGDPWNPNPNCLDFISKVCQETIRVLIPAGIFIVLSFGQPHFRIPNYLNKEEYQWSITHETCGTGLGYFFYTMRKGVLEKTEQCLRASAIATYDLKQPDEDQTTGDHHHGQPGGNINGNGNGEVDQVLTPHVDDEEEDESSGPEQILPGGYYSSSDESDS